MNGVWSRSWRSVIRRPRRSLLMVAIITLVFTALVAQSGVKSTMLSVRDAISSNVLAGFTATSQTGQLPNQTLKQLADLPGVKRHAYEGEAAAKPENASLVSAASGIQLDPEFGGDLLGIKGTSDSSLNPEFLGKIYTLEQGSHIGKPGVEAMIHRDFARKNSLHLGDTMELRHENTVVRLKIGGIYSGKAENRTGLPSGNSENQVFTNLDALQKLGGQVSTARYFTERADQLPQVLKAAQTTAPKLSLENNSAQFADVLQAISGVDQMLGMLLWGFCLAGALVLALVATFWVRSRLPEIGILLSLGKTKLEVGLQFLLEAIIFGALGAVLAVILGRLLSNSLGQLVLSKAGNETLAALEPANGIAGNAMSLGLGFLVIIIALGLALFPIMRQTPKSILSKLS